MKKAKIRKSLIGKIKQPKFFNSSKPGQRGKDKDGKAIKK